MTTFDVTVSKAGLTTVHRKPFKLKASRHFTITARSFRSAVRMVNGYKPTTTKKVSPAKLKVEGTETVSLTPSLAGHKAPKITRAARPGKRAKAIK